MDESAVLGREVEEEAGQETWENGQDLSSSASGSSSTDLVDWQALYLAQSSQSGLADGYEMGAFEGYTIQDFTTLYFQGIEAGFGVSVGVAVAMFAVAVGIKIFKKGGN